MSCVFCSKHASIFSQTSSEPNNFAQFPLGQSAATALAQTVTQVAAVLPNGREIHPAGRWIPLGTNAPGWRRFTEVITRSSSTFCQGLGTSSVRLRSDGRLQYHWAGGPYSTTGVLDRVGQ